MELVDAFLEILRRPTIGGIILGMIMLLGPVSLAFLVGIMAGWAWKPRWASLGNCKFYISASSSPCTALLTPTIKAFGPTPTPNSGGDSSAAGDLVHNKQVTLAPTYNAMSRLACLIILGDFLLLLYLFYFCFYFSQSNSD